MSALDIFEYSGQQVRTIIIDDEPWFVAVDVCAVLGISNSRDALSRLDADEKGVGIADTLGGQQQVSVVTEAGLYGLTWTSRKDEAAQFRRWVKHEVLPSINKTGTYTIETQPALPQSYADALRALADEAEKREQLQLKVVEDAPKVAYIDEFVSRDDLVKFRIAAAEIGIAEGELRDRLIARGWIYRQKIGTRWSSSKQRQENEFEYRAYSDHAAKFKPVPQHNAPRYSNGQVKQTLYIRSAFLPQIKKAVTA